MPNPERLPGGTTNADANQPLSSAAPVDRVVGLIDVDTWESIQHLAGCCDLWMDQHAPGQETIGMQADIDRVKLFLNNNPPNHSDHGAAP